MTLIQSLLFASGVTSALFVSTAYRTPVLPQIEENSSVLVAQTTTDKLPHLPSSFQANTPVLANPSVPTNTSLGRTPMMTMPIADSSVNVHLENMTDSPLVYQALGDTEPRTLAAGDDTTLSDLHVPATVTFSFENITRNRLTKRGLTMAEVSAQADGTLYLVVQPTDDLDTEASNLTVESGGNVFVF